MAWYSVRMEFAVKAPEVYRRYILRCNRATVDHGTVRVTLLTFKRRLVLVEQQLIIRGLRMFIGSVRMVLRYSWRLPHSDKLELWLRFCRSHK